jgi:hypothetical protein
MSAETIEEQPGYTVLASGDVVLNQPGVELHALYRRVRAEHLKLDACFAGAALTRSRLPRAFMRRRLAVGGLS